MDRKKNSKKDDGNFPRIGPPRISTIYVRARSDQPQADALPLHTVVVQYDEEPYDEDDLESDVEEEEIIVEDIPEENLIPSIPNGKSEPDIESDGDSEVQEDTKDTEQPQEDEPWSSRLFREHVDFLHFYEQIRPLSNRSSVSTFRFERQSEDAPQVEVSASEALRRKDLAPNNRLVWGLIGDYLKSRGMTTTVNVLSQELRSFGKLHSDVWLNEEFSVEDGRALKGLLAMGIPSSDRVFAVVEEEENESEKEGMIKEMEVFELGRKLEEEEELTEEEISSATFGQLILRLTSPNQFHSLFVNAFILTYSCFGTPELFFQKLVERYHMSQNSSLNYPPHTSRMIRYRVTNVLKGWMDFAADSVDFSSPLLQREVLLFIEDELEENEAKFLRHVVFNKTSGGVVESSRKRGVFRFSVPPPKSEVPESLFAPDLDVWNDISALELSRQLTLRDSELFRAVQPREILKKRRCPNLNEFIKRFSSIVLWVSSTIVLSKSLEKQTQNIIKAIELAVELSNLKNFNALQAVLSGINNPGVQQLKEALSKVPKFLEKSFRDLLKLMDPHDSYSAYHARILRSPSPRIPYVGAHMRELALLEEEDSCFERRKDGVHVINWTRQVKMYSILRELIEYQKEPYNLQESPQIMKCIEDVLLNCRTSHEELIVATLAPDRRRHSKQKLT